MDNSMKRRGERDLHGMLSRKKKDGKKRKGKRSLPFFPGLFISPLLSPMLTLPSPVYGDLKCGTVTGGWSICGITLGSVEEDPDGLWWQRKAWSRRPK